MVPGRAPRRPVAGAGAVLLPRRARRTRRAAAERLDQSPSAGRPGPGSSSRTAPGSGTCTCSHPSSPTSTGATPRSAPSSTTSCGSGSTAASTGSGSTPRRRWPRSTGLPDAGTRRRRGRTWRRQPALGRRRGARDLPRGGGASPTRTAATAMSRRRGRIVNGRRAPGPVPAPGRDAHRVQLRLPGRARGTPSALREAIDRRSAAHAPVGAPATWVLSSHDETRHVTRYGRADTSSA